MICSIDGCGGKVQARGWCFKHYMRWRKHGSPHVNLKEIKRLKVCSVDGCERRHRSKGMCSMHRRRVMKHGSPHIRKKRDNGFPSREHMMENSCVSESSYNGVNCREWGMSINSDGYGNMTINRKNYKSHRVMWEIENGPIEGGLHCLHHCDNRACLEIRHLFLGSNLDNVRDKMRKDRCVGRVAGRRVL